MIEWAVDQAVHGELTDVRPANYLKSGLPSYSPRGMFPMHIIFAPGNVPAQVMLGIVAQETNMAQASWHAVPGDTGNPLIADYYGTGNVTVDSMGYNEADCGYGVGQMTTGMYTADGDTIFDADERKAIAVDYAANIAANLNLLIDKIKQYPLDLGEATCALDQSTWTIPFTNGTDEWRYIGAYDLQRGARVQLSNSDDDLNASSDDGEINVAWDAMAFVPIGGNAGHDCDDDYE